MTANEYHLVSHWRVRGSDDAVFAILSDGPSFPRWWGSVYLSAEAIEQPADEGDDRRSRIAIRARGWLPYALRLTFHETERHPPEGFSVAVSGDLNGAGDWTFDQVGDEVAITFDWRVSADKAIVRTLSPLVKPLFASNHRWTMRRGEESLRLELARRSAATDAERARLPEPPKPFAVRPAYALVGVVALVAGSLAVLRRALRRRGS